MAITKWCWVCEVCSYFYGLVLVFQRVCACMLIFPAPVTSAPMQGTVPLLSSLQPAMLSSLGTLQSWWRRECRMSCQLQGGQAAAVDATGRKAMLCLAWVFHASLWCRYCDAVDLNCGCPQK